MNLDEIDPGERQRIAAKISKLIKAASPTAEMGHLQPPPGLSLRSSIRELILDLPGDLPQGARIEGFTRPQRTWHHQLGSDTEFYGYARTIQREGDDSPHSLIEIVPSPAVATQVEGAIQYLDENPHRLSNVCAEDAILSLLYVPRYDLYGFVPEPADREAADWEALAGAYAFSQTKGSAAFAGVAFRDEEAGTVLDRTELLARLRTLPSAFGVDYRAPRRVHHAGLLARVKRCLSTIVRRLIGPKVPR